LRERIGADLRVILISGGTSSLIQGLEPDERLRIVSKPVQAEQLLALMSELLAREATATS
jgi:two-component system, sensor histidine kinase